MRNLLEKSGFKLISLCHCGGTLTQTFGNNLRHPDVKIKVRPSKDSFELHKLNTRITSGKTINKLTLALQENGIIKATEVTENKEESQEAEQIIPEPEANN